MKLPKELTIGELTKQHKILQKKFPKKKAVITFSNSLPKLNWE